MKCHSCRGTGKCQTCEGTGVFPLPIKVGEVLRRIRKAKGISLEDIAKTTGLTNPVWSVFEDGDCEDENKLDLYLDAIGVPKEREPGWVEYSEELLQVSKCGHGHKELAAKIGISVSTLRSWIYKAKERLVRQKSQAQALA